MTAPNAQILAPALPPEPVARRPEPYPLVFDELRVENTNHCGYKCFMCPREKQTRELGFMAVDDFALVLDRLGVHEGAIHLHGFGEPLLDPALIEKVRLAKQRSPDSLVMFFTTLGVKLRDGFFEDLAEAGIGNLQVSFYGFNERSYEKVAGVKTFARAKANLEALATARTATGTDFRITLQTWDDEVWRTWPDDAKTERARFFAWADELGIARHEVGNVHNYGGGRDFNEVPRDGLCSVAWGFRRRVLQVTWDLKVIPCCFDFDASVSFGSLRSQSPAEIFNAEPYRRFIEAHLANRLDDYPVCVGCERCFQP